MQSALLCILFRIVSTYRTAKSAAYPPRVVP